MPSGPPATMTGHIPSPLAMHQPACQANVNPRSSTVLVGGYIRPSLLVAPLFTQHTRTPLDKQHGPEGRERDGGRHAVRIRGRVRWEPLVLLCWDRPSSRPYTDRWTGDPPGRDNRLDDEHRPPRGASCQPTTGLVQSLRQLPSSTPNVFRKQSSTRYPEQVASTL